MKYEHQINWTNAYDTNLDIYQYIGLELTNRFIIHSNFTPTQIDGKFGRVYFV